MQEYYHKYLFDQELPHYIGEVLPELIESHCSLSYHYLYLDNICNIKNLSIY